MNIEALGAVEYTKETCDDELVALRSAAERAQDAAKRFETQTKSLSETESLLLLKESKKFIKLPPSIDESQNLRYTITPYASTLMDNRPELRDNGVVTFFGCNTALPYSEAPDYSGLGELPLSTEASFGLRVISDVPSSPSRSLRMLDSALAADLGAPAQPSHTEQQQLCAEVGESPSLIIIFSSSGRPGVANLIKRGSYRLLTQNTSSTQAPKIVRTKSGPSLILVFTVIKSPVIAYSIKTGRTLSLVDEPSVPILRSIAIPDEPEIHEESFTDIQDPGILIENAGAQNQLMDREMENTANLTKSSLDVDTIKRQRSEFPYSPKSKLESPLSPLVVGRTLLHGQYSDEQPPELYLGLNKIDREAPGRLDSLYKSVFVLLLADDEAFNDIFARYVYPYIVASAKRYQDLLSEDKLCSIGREVTIMIVSDSFRDFVRDCSYKISDLNKEKIKIFVESMFRKKVAQAGNDSLESWSHVLRQKPDDVISDDMLLTFAEHNRTRISTKARQLGHITLPSRDQMSLSPDPLSAPVDYQPTQLNHTTDVSTSADFPSFIDPNPRNVPNSNFSPSAGFDNRKISHKSPFVSKRQNCVEKTHKMLNKNTRNIKRMKSDTSRNITFLHNTSSVIGDVSSEEDGERVLASFLSTSSLKESEVNIEDHSQFSSKNFSGFLDSVNEPSVARLEGIKNADDISFNKLNGKKSQKNIITHNALSAGSTSIDYNINDGDHTNLNGKPCSISNKRAFILSSAKRKVKHKSKVNISDDAGHERPGDHLLKSRPQVFDRGQHDQGVFSTRARTRIRNVEYRTSIVKGDTSIAFDPNFERLLSALATQEPQLKRPYNPQMGNLITVGNKHNDLKHVDFSDEELEAILNAFIALNPSSFISETDEQARARFSTKLLEISHKEASEIIRYVHSDPNNILQARKGKSIRAFLSDLAKDRMPKRPVFNRVELELVDPVHVNKRSTASLLCDREHGFNSRAGSNRSILSELRLQISETLSPWRSWKGASGDVVTCAWGPDSSTYAVGAAAPMNDEDLQYNRPGNLLRGNLISNTLEELPDHRIDRPKPETISSGPNSSQAVYDASDPVVYTTVSALKFAPDGSRLYTASHDKTVKIWDTSLAKTSCVRTLHHNGLVTDLDVSQFYAGVFASASKVVNGAIQVYYPDNSDNTILSSMHLTSPRAKEHPGWELFPECLHWGKTQSTKHLLLAGFLQWGGVLDRDLVREGQVCLWDINNGEILKVCPGSQSVFTATWHPFYDIFATGGAPSRTRALSNRKTTKSVVRVWDIRNIGLARCSIEYECPALDMQDLSFHPIRSNIIAAGCTDSATYIWDYRKPDEVLLKLEHGKPILDWDHTKHQEEADSGIMMTAWGPENALLYTGSSDGVVKCWDTSRSPEDAFVRDVADLGSGVQSGAFSPDFTHLLIGDADGAVHVLSSAPVDGWHDNGSAVQPINLVRAHDPNRNNDEDPQNQGILAAKELLESGQLLLNNEYGVGKGPNYKGPYARYARPKNADPTAHLLPEFDALQPYSFNGHERPEIARQMKGVIMGRKANIASTKELEEGLLELKIEDYECGIQDQIANYPSKKRKDCSSDDFFPASKKIKVEVIDLSSDTYSPPNETLSSDRTYEVPSSRENPIIIDSDSEDSEENIEDHESKMPLDDESSEGDMLEDDHWWPRLDEDVFRALGVRG